MKSDIGRMMIVAVAAVAVLFAVGCSKLTMDNYDKLQVGMTYNEVTAILGEPDSCDGAIGLKNCVWGDKDKNIKVNFGGDRVLVFSSHNL